MLRTDQSAAETAFSAKTQHFYPRNNNFVASAPVSPTPRPTTSSFVKAVSLTDDMSRTTEIKHKDSLQAIKVATSRLSESSSLVLDTNQEFKSLKYLSKPRQKPITAYQLPEVMAARETPPLSPEVEGAGAALPEPPLTFIDRPMFSNNLPSLPSPPSPLGSNSRPCLIRKKSGEILKSSLKLPVLARAKSLPSTKSVHFDTKNLCDVRTFNRKQQPRAVSIDMEFSDDEGDLDEDEEASWTLSSSFHPPNYDSISPEARPVVHLEGVYMSTDKKCLRGNILVRNLGYEKNVVVRYTVDNWKNSVDIQASYNSDIRRRDKAAGFDRFSFELSVDNLGKSSGRSSVSMQLAIKYVVNNQEYWDNNLSQNYTFFFRESTRAYRAPRSYFSIPLGNKKSKALEDNFSTSPSMEEGLLSALSNMGNSAYEIGKSADFYSSTGDYDEQLARDMNRKTNSGLKSRYSFKDAYKASSDKEQEEISPNSPLGAKESTAGAAAAATTSTGGRVFPPVEGPNTMSSISYQDVISKYCFFTPGSNTRSPVKSAPAAAAPTASTKAGPLAGKSITSTPVETRSTDAATTASPAPVSAFPMQVPVPASLRTCPQQQNSSYLSKAATDFSPWGLHSGSRPIH